MRRILCVALVVMAAGSLAVLPSHAAKRGHKQKTLAAMAASDCSGMVCRPGSCPLQAKAAVSTKSAQALSAKAGGCPVSDPSACPPGCARVGASAVAVAATH